MDIEIPCPHEVEQFKNLKQVVPDYHPLSKEDITKMLTIAKTSQEPLTSRIHSRLTQGIVGMTCPRPVMGKLGIKQRQLNNLFVETLLQSAEHDLVEKFYQIMPD